jgi:hypothetical protein
VVVTSSDRGSQHFNVLRHWQQLTVLAGSDLTDRTRTGHGPDTDSPRTVRGQSADCPRTGAGQDTDSPRTVRGQSADCPRTGAGPFYF